jgi:hypothetical protein
VDLAFEVLDQEEAFLVVAFLVSSPEVAPSSFLEDGHVDEDFEDLGLEVALVGFLTVLQTERYKICDYEIIREMGIHKCK